MLSNVTLSARQIGSRHQKRLVAGTESVGVGEAAVWFSQRVTAACARDDLWPTALWPLMCNGRAASASH